MTSSMRRLWHQTLMADMLAQVWLWVADAFEGRPVAALLTALAFAALIGGAVFLVGA